MSKNIFQTIQNFIYQCYITVIIFLKKKISLFVYLISKRVNTIICVKKKKQIIRIIKTAFPLFLNLIQIIPILLITIIFIFCCIWFYVTFLQKPFEIFEQAAWYYIISNKVPDAMEKFLTHTFMFRPAGNTLAFIPNWSPNGYFYESERMFYLDNWFHEHNTYFEYRLHRKRRFRRKMFLACWNKSNEYLPHFDTWFKAELRNLMFFSLKLTQFRQWNEYLQDIWDWNYNDVSSYYVLSDIYGHRLRYSWSHGHISLHFKHLNLDYLPSIIWKQRNVDIAVKLQLTKYSFAALLSMYICGAISESILGYYVDFVSVSGRDAKRYGKKPLQYYEKFVYSIIIYLDKVLAPRFSNTERYKTIGLQPVVRFGVFYRSMFVVLFFYLVCMVILNAHIGFLCMHWIPKRFIMWLGIYGCMVDNQIANWWSTTHTESTLAISEHYESLAPRQKKYTLVWKWRKWYARLNKLELNIIIKKYKQQYTEERYPEDVPSRLLPVEIWKEKFLEKWSQIRTIPRFKKFKLSNTASKRPFKFLQKTLRWYRHKDIIWEDENYLRRVSCDKKKQPYNYYEPHREFCRIFEHPEWKFRERNSLFRRYINKLKYSTGYTAENKDVCHMFYLYKHRLRKDMYRHYLKFKILGKYLKQRIPNVINTTKKRKLQLTMSDTKNRYYSLSEEEEWNTFIMHHKYILKLNQLWKPTDIEAIEMFEEDAYVLHDITFPKEWGSLSYYQYESNITELHGFDIMNDDVDFENIDSEDQNETPEHEIIPIDYMHSVPLFDKTWLPNEDKRMLLSKDKNCFNWMNYINMLYDHHTESTLQETDFEGDVHRFMWFEIDPFHIRSRRRFRKNRYPELNMLRYNYLRYLKTGLGYKRFYKRFVKVRKDAEGNEYLDIREIMFLYPLYHFRSNIALNWIVSKCLQFLNMKKVRALGLFGRLGLATRMILKCIIILPKDYLILPIWISYKNWIRRLAPKMFLNFIGMSTELQTWDGNRKETDSVLIDWDRMKKEQEDRVLRYWDHITHARTPKQYSKAKAYMRNIINLYPRSLFKKAFTIKKLRHSLNYSKQKWKHWFDLHYYISYTNEYHYHHRWGMLTRQGKIKNSFDTRLSLNYPLCIQQIEAEPNYLMYLQQIKA